MARARAGGSEDLKIPEPTNTPSAPSCIISAASAGVASPPAEKFTTGSLPSSATLRASSSGARSSFAVDASSAGSIEPSRLIPAWIARMCRTASTTLPVPASPFVRIIAAPSALSADARRHALGRHHRTGPRLLGDARLLGVRDVHDHAALEHLGQPAL